MRPTMPLHRPADAAGERQERWATGASDYPIFDAVSR